MIPAHKIDAGRIQGFLKFAEANKTRRLHVSEPPKGKHKYSEEQEELQDIHRYISNTRWQLAEADDKVTVTWLELMMHYEFSGYSYRHTKEAKEEDLKRRREQREGRVLKLSLIHI